MKAYLMFKDKDFKIIKQETSRKTALMSDLELEYILETMAKKDKVVYETCKEVLLNPLISIEEVYYRQDNLSDVLKNGDSIRILYDIAVETEKESKKNWRWFTKNYYLQSTFSNSLELLDLYIEMLEKIRFVADHNINNFHSVGFRNLFIMFQRELDDEYIKMAKSQLNDLKGSDGISISATIGNHLQGIQYVLRQKKEKGFWRKWLFAPSYTIAPRDDSGAKDIEERRKRAINESTNILAQATENLESFFSLLKRELAFYVGCLDLYETIKQYEMPICLPHMLTKDTYDRSCDGLYDLSLLLTKKQIL